MNDLSNENEELKLARDVRDNQQVEEVMKDVGGEEGSNDTEENSVHLNS